MCLDWSVLRLVRHTKSRIERDQVSRSWNDLFVNIDQVTHGAIISIVRIHGYFVQWLVAHAKRRLERDQVSRSYTSSLSQSNIVIWIVCLDWSVLRLVRHTKRRIVSDNVSMSWNDLLLQSNIGIWIVCTGGFYQLLRTCFNPFFIDNLDHTLVFPLSTSHFKVVYCGLDEEEEMDAEVTSNDEAIDVTTCNLTAFKGGICHTHETDSHHDETNLIEKLSFLSEALLERMVKLLVEGDEHSQLNHDDELLPHRATPV